jgi:signal transduction histidine kinase
MGPDGTATLVASHGAKGDTMPVGLRFRPVLPSLIALVAETGRSARVDDYEDTSAMGAVAAVVAGEEIRSSVGCPIIVEGQLWGQITVASREGPLPADSEQRIMAFTELVATAIANAQNRAEVTASRARIVTASDETRRRIERDLHDGIQQRLVTLALDMRTVGDTVAPQSEELAESVSQLGDSLRNVIDELHEIARGVHPAILSEGGLTPAVKALARRSPVPMELHVRNVERLPEQVEVAAYYVVSEAITNTAKHARATVARVDLDVRDGTLHLSVRDDGVGGADPARGSGIVGLTDRVTALGGTLVLRSPPGEGTAIDLALPINAALSGGRLSASVEEGDHSEDTPVVGVGGRDR